MNQPLISVIVPVFNVEKYLNECVTSIINQTYTNMEIILIDDGSSDNSPIMCDNFAKQDSRIIVIHKENGGQSSARNAGLDAAKGEFVMFVDSDDFIDKQLVEYLLSITKEYSVDIACCSKNRYIKGKSFLIKDSVSTQQNIVTFTGLQYLDRILRHKVGCAVWGKLYRYSSIKDFRFPLLRYNEDVIFLFYLCLSSIKIACTPKPYYNYRKTEGGLTQVFNQKKFDVLRNAQEMADYIKMNKLSNLSSSVQIYSNIVNINLMGSMIKHRAQKRFYKQFKELRCRVMHNLLEILTNRNYNYKLKIKAIVIVFFFFK